MPETLEETLDLSVLDSFDFSPQEPTKKIKSPTDELSLNLSVLDELFPAKTQPLSSPPAKITSKFGKRNDPFGAGIRFHNGVDIPMTANTPVNSLGKGVVINIGDSGKKDYGRFIEVDYGGGLVLTYGHLNKIAVERGDRVSQEAILGLSGSTGRSKGPHLHIKAKLNGKPVNPEDYFGGMHDIAIGALSNEDVVSEAQKLDLSVLDNLEPELEQAETDSEKLDLSSLDQIGEVKPIEETPFVDRRTIEEKIASGAAAIGGKSKHKISVTNPNQLIGDRITTIIPTKGALKPDINTVTDYWLGAIDPNYSRINQEYRGQTGKNLVEFDGKPQFIGDGKYELTARLTKGSVELINAYIDGRNKGGPEAGWEAAYLKSQEINRREAQVKLEIEQLKQESTQTFAQRHPYITALSTILPSPINPLSIATQIDAVKAGIANVGIAEAQLIHNLRLLPEAIYKLERYGGDSPEYEALMRRDEAVQKALEEYSSEVYQPESTPEKIVSGAVTGAVSFPKYALAGSVGIAGLPLLVYVESMHRGNREATMAALPMALMVGASHGMNQFLNSGTKIYLNTLDDSGTPINKVVEVGRGLGNKAPFSRIREELSLDPKVQEAFLAGDSASIASFSPLERQILMRGTNALLGAGALAVEGGSLQDVATNFVVGLTFPVGKYRIGSLTEGKLVENPPIDSPTTEQFLLENKRIEVPISPAPTFGEKQLPIIEQQREIPPVVYPSAESPKVEKYGEPFNAAEFPAQTERGFQARGQGSTLFLNMDTAALQLLDLRRSLTDKNFIGTGKVGLKESIKRQIAIQKAIGVLEKQIPKEVVEYFAENEALIRKGMKTNWEAVRAKEEYLGAKKLTPEVRTPEEIKDNPNIEAKEGALDRLKAGLIRVAESNKSPEVVREIANNTFGNAGEKNRFITPDRVLLAYDRLLNTKSKGGTTLRSVGPQDLPAIGRELVEGTKAIWDLTQIAAFHLEDFYHRKVEPSVAELANRFRLTLGDAVKGFKDEDFQTLFQKGKEYLDSNNADPFFSRMKQDAIEKLPNRFTEEQARNILSQHKDEFEWTVGLEEFLVANEYTRHRKINKKDLIDIIQEGQVRVEESVARETPEIGSEEWGVLNRLAQISERLKALDNYLEPKSVEQITTDNIEWNKLMDEQKILFERKYEIESAKPRYSLKAYRGEQLELPGAVNSKEVKLITPSSVRDVNEYQRERNNPQADYVEERYNVKYQAPHWDEPNVVAHYRANDRISTDGKRIYFSEEFQSDWNHDIREKGLKGRPNELPDGYKVIENPDYGQPNQKSKFIVVNRDGLRFGKGNTELEAIVDYAGIGGIEPNPFMGHLWKELVMKRFIRDAVVAKDENGNYKYDAVSWTTARQQKERYGKVLEGKEFKWKKNSDGTYSFDLMSDERNEFWQSPHELRNISLERFAELTTKEAAEEVRAQEANYPTKRYLIKRKGFDQYLTKTEGQFLKDLKEARYFTTEKEAQTYADSLKIPEQILVIRDPLEAKGQFSLKEAVELRSGIGKYSDYDVALVNIAKKIGKRFGAKYEQREIELGRDGLEPFDKFLAKKGTTFDKWEEAWNQNEDAEKYAWAKKLSEEHYATGSKAKVHSLEITPSMRQSLSKEGLPLYGLGESAPLKYPEFGARNRIVTTDAFNEVRNNLVKKLAEMPRKPKWEYSEFSEELVREGQERILNADKETAEHIGQQIRTRDNVFNSGLNPDAFVDQVKLLYSGIKDLAEFTSALVKRYGEPIREFAEDFYWAIRDKGAEFNEKFNVAIKDWQSNLNKVAQNPAWQIRQGEHGKIFLSKKSPEIEEYFKDKSKHQVAIGLDYRAWLRGVALSQISTEFGKVYDTLRIAQRVVHSYESNILEQLKLAKKVQRLKLDKPVAEAIYDGNENKQVFTDPELAARGLNAEQIQSYRNFRAAVDNVLNLRLEGKIYAVKQKANKLNDELLTLTPGTTQHDAVLEKLMDLNDAEVKMSAYYQSLKDSGYVTIQRRGKIAAFLEDPSYPVGDPKRKIYNQFNSRKEADAWMQKQKEALGIPKGTLAGNIYDIRNLKDIALKEKLTPSQFEDLVDRSGANSNDSEIEKIRSEVYSKFPSFTYQLDREFIRGYDRDLQTAIDSTVHQAELYASSFYSKIGGEEGLKALEATGLEKTDPNLYRIASQYIKDETAPAELNWLAKKAIQARRLTYLWQLGFDLNQLYLNAVAQPITQTYGYFSRIEHNGRKLTGLEPEHYFAKAIKLAAKGGDPEFETIKKQLIAEHVLAPEFTKTLIESQTGTGKATKLEHWASVFMQKGEKATRTHAAAEAYLIGKEKFSLAGDELVKFMVKAVDATQSNPTRGENPYAIRTLGEGGKLFYQFMAFNQMWWENLGIGLKQSKGAAAKTAFAAREFAPLAIMGGIANLPLSSFASSMYILLTGRDPKKDADSFLGDDTFMEKLVRYGITTSAGLSQKVVPSTPILDQTGRILTADVSGGIGSLADNLPALATGDQLIRGAIQLTDRKKRLKGVANLAPRFLKGPIKSAEASGIPGILEPSGFKTPAGRVLLSKRKQTPLQLLGQTINITPTPVIEKYERDRTRKLKKKGRKLRRALSL